MLKFDATTILLAAVSIFVSSCSTTTAITSGHIQLTVSPRCMVNGSGSGHFRAISLHLANAKPNHTYSIRVKAASSRFISPFGSIHTDRSGAGTFSTNTYTEFSPTTLRYYLAKAGLSGPHAVFRLVAHRSQCH